MGTDGISFDAKFAVYEKYLKANASRLGLNGEKLGEQFGRYSVGLQYDETKRANKNFGREYGKALGAEKRDYVRFWEEALSQKEINDARKAEIRERLKLNKGQLSGVVKADRIAEEKIKAYKNEARLIELEKELAYEKSKLNRFKKLAAHKGEISGVVKADEIAASKIASNGSKFSKVFKGAKGKYAIAAGIASFVVGGGIALFGGKKDKKVEEFVDGKSNVDEKLDDIVSASGLKPEVPEAKTTDDDVRPDETVDDPQVVVPPVTPGEVEDEAPQNEDVKPEDADPAVVPDTTESDAEVGESDEESDKPVSETESDKVAPEEKPVEDEKLEDTKPEASADDKAEKVEPDIVEVPTVASLKEQIRANKEENKDLRAQIRDIRKSERAEARAERLADFQVRQEAEKAKAAEQKALKDAERAEKKVERAKLREEKLAEYQARQEARKAEWAEQKAIKDAKRAEQKVIRAAKKEERKAINAEFREQKNQYRQDIKAIRQETKQAIREIRLQAKKEIQEYKTAQA